jgi:hypothetical protein
MSAITLKIELNKGRRGIVVQKLAKIAEEAEKFLEFFAADMNLSKTEWLAENFDNGSVEFELTYAGVAEPSIVALSNKALGHLIKPETTFESLDFGLSQETLIHFAKMAHPLDVDDYIIVGSRNGDNQFHTQKLTKERSLLIEQQANQMSERYASFQGTITALFKDNYSCWLKDYLTDSRVVCFYKNEHYPQIWRLLENRDSLVNIEGWHTVRHTSKGSESRLKIESIRPLPDYEEGDIDAFFGCDKDFTGGKTTEEHLNDIRGEDF